MPFKSQLHVDQLLSNISIKYRNADLIWDKVFPELMVKKDTDLYRVYSRNFRLPETRRADGGMAKEHNFNVSTASYALEKHALKTYVSDDAVDNYDMASLRADTTEELTDVVQRRMENSVAVLFTTSSWSLNVSLAAAGQYSLNTTTSNPIPNFDTGATTVIQNSGFKPNYGIIPRQDLVNIKNHTSVLDRVKYTSAEVSEVMIASLLGLEELLVPTAQLDSAAEGITDSIGDMWNDSCFLGYKPKRPSPLAPSAGYMFRKAKPMVKRWRAEERESEAIEVNVSYQPKVIASLAGYLIKDTRA